jgi:hypothetical protein
MRVVEVADEGPVPSVEDLVQGLKRIDKDCPSGCRLGPRPRGARSRCVWSWRHFRSLRCRAPGRGTTSSAVEPARSCLDAQDWNDMRGAIDVASLPFQGP